MTDTMTQPTSQLLFIKDTGESMQFYMRPCRERVEIRKLIENGGGQLSTTSSKCVEESINLHVSGDPCFSDDYYDSKFIKDCVKDNCLLDLQDYKIECVSRTKHVIKKRKLMRVPYTYDEDNAILQHVAKKHLSVDGNKMWQEMERAKVTQHSWQSMKDRFRKHIKDRLPEFMEIDEVENIDDGEPVSNITDTVKQTADENTGSDNEEECCMANTSDTGNPTEDKIIGNNDEKRLDKRDIDEKLVDQIFKDEKEYMKKYNLTFTEVSAVYFTNNYDRKKVEKWFHDVEKGLDK